MSTLPFCAEHGNPNPEYSARTTGHADGSAPFEDDHDLHRAMLAQLDHEQAVDCGDDVVNADAALAEARLRQAFPRAESVIVAREQERLWHREHGGSFQARWSVYVSAGSLYASAPTLNAALAAVLVKAGSGDVPPTLLAPAAASAVASAI